MEKLYTRSLNIYLNNVGNELMADESRCDVGEMTALVGRPDNNLLLKIAQGSVHLWAGVHMLYTCFH